MVIYLCVLERVISFVAIVCYSSFCLTEYLWMRSIDLVRRNIYKTYIRRLYLWG